MISRKNLTNVFSNYEVNLERAIDRYRKDDQFLRYFELGITLLIVAFFVFMAIKPAVVTISSLVGEIKQKEELSVQMEKKINAIIAAQEKYAIIQEQAALIDTFLPIELNLSSGLSQAIGAGRDSRLEVSGVDLNKVEMVTGVDKEKLGTKKDKNKEENLFGLGFSLNAKGDYFSLRDFVDRIIGVRRWLVLEEYQIMKGKEEVSDTLIFSSKGKIFHWLNLKEGVKN